MASLSIQTDKLAFFSSYCAQRILDLIYPRWCLACGLSLQATQHFYVCPDCIRKIDYIPPDEACPRCGHALGPYRQNIKNQIACPDCRGNGLTFIKQVIAVGKYDNILRNLILQFKYGSERLLAAPLAALLIERLKTSGIINQIDIIIPVPLHVKRLKTRGFNQAELVAQYISRAYKTPFSVDNLIRIKDITPQAALPRQARLTNPQNAFALKKPAEIRKKNILLIDDVLTTGATAQEIARVLREAGANHIYVAVLAR
jgi:competence protein ComFC